MISDINLNPAAGEDDIVNVFIVYKQQVVDLIIVPMVFLVIIMVVMISLSVLQLIIS